MDSRSFFLFPNMTSLTCYFILHMSGSPGRYGNQVYQLGGLLFTEAFLFQVKTLAKVKHNYLLRGRHLLLRELVTNFFAS